MGVPCPNIYVTFQVGNDNRLRPITTHFEQKTKSVTRCTLEAYNKDACSIGYLDTVVDTWEYHFLSQKSSRSQRWHRALSVAAKGIKHIPLRIGNSIYFNNVTTWRKDICNVFVPTIKKIPQDLQCTSRNFLKLDPVCCNNEGLMVHGVVGAQCKYLWSINVLQRSHTIAATCL